MHAVLVLYFFMVVVSLPAISIGLGCQQCNSLTLDDYQSKDQRDESIKNDRLKFQQCFTGHGDSKPCPGREAFNETYSTIPKEDEENFSKDSERLSRLPVCAIFYGITSDKNGVIVRFCTYEGQNISKVCKKIKTDHSEVAEMLICDKCSENGCNAARLTSSEGVDAYLGKEVKKPGRKASGSGSKMNKSSTIQSSAMTILIIISVLLSR